MKPAQIQYLQEALSDCFSRADLKEFVFYHFSEDLSNIVSEKENDKVAFFEFIKWIREKQPANGYLKVLRYAHESQPDHPGLKELAKQFGLKSQSNTQASQDARAPILQVPVRVEAANQASVLREHWLGFLGQSDAWTWISDSLGILKPESARFRPLSPSPNIKQSVALIVRYHDADAIGLLVEAISHHLGSEGNIPDLENSGWSKVKTFDLPSSGNLTDLMANLALDYSGVEESTVSLILKSSPDVPAALAELIEKSYIDDSQQSRVARAILHDPTTSKVGKIKLSTIKKFVNWWNTHPWSQFTQPVLIVFFVLSEERVSWHQKIIRSVLSRSVQLDEAVSLTPVSDHEFLAWKDNFLDTKLKMASSVNPPDWWFRVRDLDWPAAVTEWLEHNKTVKVIRIKHVEKMLFRKKPRKNLYDKNSSQQTTTDFK